MRKRRNKINVNLGNMLREIRLNQSMSQEKAARRLGILRTSLVNIEYGRQNIHIAMLQEFAEMYGVRLKDLIEKAA